MSDFGHGAGAFREGEVDVAVPSDLQGAEKNALVPLDLETVLEVPTGVRVLEDERELDTGSIIEEAEEILREGAPHDFDVLVIGGGPGGYVAAIKAAQLGAHVGLVEERELGGVCLNRGCIPTKTLLEAVDVMRLLRRADVYGLKVDGEIRLDMARMNARKREVVQELRSHVAHLLEENGIEVLQGRARFVEEHAVEVFNKETGETQRISAVHIVIATGSLPTALPVPGADLPGVVKADDLLDGEIQPRNLLVIGAGAVGVEFAYLYRHLGAQATLLEKAPHVMPQEDDEIGEEMERILRDMGVAVHTDAELLRLEEAPGGLDVVYNWQGQERRTRAEAVLMATGRKANTDGLGLDEAGIEHRDGQIVVNDYCETNVNGVYAIGDCIRNVGWAHLASAEGTMVAEIITKNQASVDLSHVPSCYYTHPEIATVGLTRQQAEEKGYLVRVGRFSFRTNGKAAAAGEHEGFVKVVVDDESNRLLGCQIVGPRATDLISEAVLALKAKQTVDEMVGAIHAHPTFSEALPEAALAARRPVDLEDDFGGLLK